MYGWVLILFFVLSINESVLEWQQKGFDKFVGSTATSAVRTLAARWTRWRHGACENSSIITPRMTQWRHNVDSCHHRVSDADNWSQIAELHTTQVHWTTRLNSFRVLSTENRLPVPNFGSFGHHYEGMKLAPKTFVRLCSWLIDIIDIKCWHCYTGCSSCGCIRAL